MNCQEIRALLDAYLDSELEVKTSLEIQQHLKACAPCARWFEAEQKSVSRLDHALRHGESTPAVWARAEQLVRDATTTPHRDVVEPGTRSKLAPVGEPWWRAWLWPSPQFYAGLAAVWAVMLTFHWLTLNEPSHRARAVASPSPEVRRALAEQRRELVEMLGLVTGSLPAPVRESELNRPQSRQRPSGRKSGPAGEHPNVSDAFHAQSILNPLWS
ncbi:MAG: anti-sigma factor family protein [Limisphaerales bacterium]